MNVALITLDAFRKDLIDRGAVPYLSDLAGQSLYFNNAISTGSGTSSSFPGILAGALPLDYGYAKFRPNHTLLAEQIDQKSFGISSSLPTSSIYNFDRGFTFWEDNVNNSYLGELRKIIRENKKLLWIGEKVLYMKNRFVNEDQAPSYTPADQVTDTALSKIRSETDVEFLWAHYMETHTPYYPKENFLTKKCNYKSGEINSIINQYHQSDLHIEDKAEDLVPESSRGDMKEMYRAEARFLDEEVQRLVENLRSQSEDWAIIICADHGEEFFEHGHFGHQPKVYDELVNVPLIINAPNIESSVIDAPISLSRIPHTVCDFLDTEPASNWRGSSLLDTAKGDEFVITELSHTADQGLGGSVDPEKAIIGVRSKNKKFILDKQSGENEIYDLESDPMEQTNLIDNKKIDLADDLRQEAEDRFSTIADNKSELDDEVPDDVKSRLEDLGYVDS